MKLTDAQNRAMVAVREAGTVYAYNGISVATAHKLEQLGLVTFNWHGVSGLTSYRTKRTQWTADWSITLVEAVTPIAKEHAGE